jgi:dimethylargininase
MFTHAIVRRPGPDFGDGITTADLGTPDYAKTLEQHAAYCDALKGCGLELIILDPEPGYPDCPFVEDTAVVTDETAVIARPGDERRRGEEEAIAFVLSRYRRIERIEPPGTLDGGDVLQVKDRFFIGRSARTNEEGARQLSSILTRHGHQVSITPVGEMLHLKSGANHIGNGVLTLAGGLQALDVFSGFESIHVPPEECYAANCLFVNGRLLFPTGFPHTMEKLSRLGRQIIELDMSEFRKMDGGLTCLSIRL